MSLMRTLGRVGVGAVSAQIGKIGLAALALVLLMPQLIVIRAFAQQPSHTKACRHEQNTDVRFDIEERPFWGISTGGGSRGLDELQAVLTAARLLADSYAGPLLDKRVQQGGHERPSAEARVSVAVEDDRVG